MQFNLLKPTGYLMHQQFNIQQLYALPTLCLFIYAVQQDTQSVLMSEFIHHVC